MKVEDIARLLDGQLTGEGAGEIRGVAGLDNAGPNDLTFAEGERILKRAANCRAGCILVPSGAALAGQTTIAVRHPKLALIRATAAPAPAGGCSSAGGRKKKKAVIEKGVSIGKRTVIGAGVFLGRSVEVGAYFVIPPRVSIYPQARLGSRVVIHAGTVIGADGFGYVFAEGRHHKFPQLGQVVIEDDVEIGSNTTIDRGSLGNTVIGEGTKIDNLVQIAHNVRVGRPCVMAAQTGISGSVEIGDYVVIGGQVGVGDKVRIESQAVIGAQAGIPTGKIVRRGSAMWGNPARPVAEFKKTYAQISNLPKLARKVNELARRAGASSGSERS